MLFGQWTHFLDTCLMIGVLEKSDSIVVMFYNVVDCIQTFWITVGLLFQISLLIRYDI